ncbi:MAG: pentapeptide repeat-containing protein [candidate division Zixibacteria bacterium]|nr:pentapeptide repeat-containing protein [candidate division Zixibacteria bacterium]
MEDDACLDNQGESPQDPNNPGKSANIERISKDSLDKLKIIVNLAVTVVLAGATIMGSIVIPEYISRQSLKSQKIIQLSELVPELYDTDSTTTVRPKIIAMTSYGAPAVPFLLLVMYDATTNEDSEMIQSIVSAMKYMDNESKAEVEKKLEFEVDQLAEYRLAENIEYIGYMIDILTALPLSATSQRVLAKYFSIVSTFEVNQPILGELNIKILKALSSNGYPVSRLKLRGLDFETGDLSGVDFRRADLTAVNLTECNLANCDFTDALLSSCNLAGVRFYNDNDNTQQTFSVFKNLASSDWQNAIFDPAIRDILKETENETQDQEKIISLIENLRGE